ncbi:hypothetical protein [Methanimicrococcus blatticola]|uniref:Uncharacterized protein n=1 Tax=Methanimicrococcus blatticola TaxID=91560 RepID=A0A484F3H9_9EURY|nr:hypothetical protein [Methanimicrococcus blatticola]MBZ3935263.1 hypothetical protein [Methanimicrococcus blatticola]MCC2508639.1 hypothetical protein [Methanimicrococcus blatticola]TDQ67944.1 hypothetical protein C7391_1498 [Methanimicrococcus blatticola]
MVTETSESYPLLSDSAMIDEISRTFLETGQSNTAVYHLTEFIDSVSSLTLRHPLKLNLKFENGLYLVENSTFNIFSFSDNLKTAIQDIERHLFFLWEEYVLDDERNLAPESIQLKNILKEYLEEIECSQKHIKQGKSNRLS